MIVAFVPETYAPVLLRRKAIQLRKETGEQRWQAPLEKMNKSVARTVLWSCIRPFQLLVLEPMCLNLCILVSPVHFDLLSCVCHTDLSSQPYY